jgi:hypothetical protein
MTVRLYGIPNPENVSLLPPTEWQLRRKLSIQFGLSVPIPPFFCLSASSLLLLRLHCFCFGLKGGFGAGIQLNAFRLSASSLFFFLSICLFSFIVSFLLPLKERLRIRLSTECIRPLCFLLIILSVSSCSR